MGLGSGIRRSFRWCLIRVREREEERVREREGEREREREGGRERASERVSE